MRITIAEILVLFVGIAALLAASQLPPRSEYVWMDSTLAYKSPIVPVEFDDNEREPPYSVFTGLSIQINLDDWKDGPTFYKSTHRRGWESCRYHFVTNESVEPRPIPDPSTLPTDSWDQHSEFAFYTGYNACSQQIAELLQRTPKWKLQNRICYSKHLITAPLTATFLMSVGVFSAMRYRNRRTVD